MTYDNSKFNSIVATAYHNVLRLEETKRKYSRTTTSFRGRNAMELLYETGDKKASEIADYLKITRPSATTLLKKLQELGYIEGKTDPQDERSTIISLTRKGRLVTTLQTKHRDDVLQSVLSKYTDEEKETIAKCFTELNQVFEDCAYELESTYSKREQMKKERKRRSR
ncbi:MAG: winged helix DNA-binding protein [Clostridia bacterium]|nr:winged helix DNA-binding protein [Clostridia bacterium]